MIAGEMIVNNWCYWDQRETAQFSIGNSQITPWENFWFKKSPSCK